VQFSNLNHEGAYVIIRLNTLSNTTRFYCRNYTNTVAYTLTFKAFSRISADSSLVQHIKD